ncbi:MAG: hypothetical protein GXP45_02545 [bacterium]|nr:hypothetical protein [bacterium]
MDDIFEVFSVIIAVAFLPILIHAKQVSIHAKQILLPLFLLIAIISLGVAMISLCKRSRRFQKTLTKYHFFFSIMIFFLFIGLGALGNMAAIGAIMGGIVASSLVDKKNIKGLETEIRDIAYYLL